MVKIAVCDDLLTDAGQVEECLLNGPFKVECEVFSSAEELLSTLEHSKQKFDMYVLDIEMSGMSGIALAEKIRESDISCLIVFLTSFPEYVHKTFDAVVFDYILKPISQERADRLLMKAKRYLLPASGIFHYNFNKLECSIRTSEIYFFQREKRKMVFSLTNGTEKYAYMSMDDVLSQLDEAEFVRISYSFIVNLKYIENMRGQNVTMENGITLICNKTMLGELKQRHLHYVNRS